MILTRALLHSAGTSNCGFNYHQLQALGVPWPPKAGWLTGLIGKEISEDQWQLVLSLKHKRKKERRQIMADTKERQQHLIDLVTQFSADD
jgi:hypothetical protein